ncbi:hypothetical protein [Mycolicibacterium sp.]|uniref:hypothetical protein n=1 Tax=Mycolicibacterium sp. TaxID=2320850 RepID=UPI0037C5DAB1
MENAHERQRDEFTRRKEESDGRGMSYSATLVRRSTTEHHPDATADVAALFETEAGGDPLPMAAAVELLATRAGYTEEEAVIYIDEAIEHGDLLLNNAFELCQK